MRIIKCEKCGEDFQEDDSNPSIHYSNPSKICWHCNYEMYAPEGTWLQNSNGEYYQK